MNSLSSYCGLVDARIRASEKDLPVWKKIVKEFLEICKEFYLEFEESPILEIILYI